MFLHAESNFELNSADSLIDGLTAAPVVDIADTGTPLSFAAMALITSSETPALVSASVDTGLRSKSTVGAD